MTDADVLAHMRRRDRWGTFRRLWYFLLPNDNGAIYRAIIRLWWKGDVEIRWHRLQARAKDVCGAFNELALRYTAAVASISVDPSWQRGKWR